LKAGFIPAFFKGWLATMKKSKRITLLQTKNFGLVIGVFIFLLLMLFNALSPIPKELEKYVHDISFQYKSFRRTQVLQEGAYTQVQNIRISPDIQIIGMDSNTLARVGKWPFPRHEYANFLTSLARIRDENRRESSVFLDILFLDKGTPERDDALFIESIKENNRVFSEVDINYNPPSIEVQQEMYTRMQYFFDQYGNITNIQGDTDQMPVYYGVTAPLRPISKNSVGYGHASFAADSDEIYRRQAVVAKVAFQVNQLTLNELNLETRLQENQSIAWTDNMGIVRYFSIPASQEELFQLQTEIAESAPLKQFDDNGDGDPDREDYILRVYEHYYIPSITLSLALNYFNKDLADLEIHLGEEVVIPYPQRYNTDTKQWEPYSILKKPALINEETNEIIQEPVYEILQEIRIPIDNEGNMLVNFMGKGSSEFADGHRTFNIRSMAGYTSRIPGPDPGSWPRTKALDNQIVMLGAFTKGIAEDEKYTPYGSMYGVELHANALNTIIMNNFLNPVSDWINWVILFLTISVITFISSRAQTVVAFLVSLFLLLSLFITNTLLFETQNLLIDFSLPAIGIISSFILVMIYRAMTEEKDKKRIQSMFGKYVSPKVVSQLVDSRMPELGGVDMELTVLFSDIRGFTTLSESMSPQELVHHLNEYLSAMTDLILEYNGTLDKYVGDEIMCFWGAPIPQKEHALLACKCALRMMEELHRLNTNWSENKRIDIGIGLNSGVMTVGNMGSLGRMNYTLMGDNVNLGARLEGTNKQYLTNIIISEYTYSLVKETAIVRELDNIRVKGKNKPVLIYELLDFIDGIDPPVKAK